MGSSATPYLHVTLPSQILYQKSAQKGLKTGMLTCKLPLIVIVAQRKLYSDRQIGVGAFRYGDSVDSLFTRREGVT